VLYSAGNLYCCIGMGNTTSCSCESEPAAANGSTFVSEETSRRELAALPNKDLRARARAAGATPAQLDAAADSADPKAALVALVLVEGKVHLQGLAQNVGQAAAGL
jgi:hypothetical protein